MTAQPQDGCGRWILDAGNVQSWDDTERPVSSARKVCHSLELGGGERSGPLEAYGERRLSQALNKIEQDENQFYSLVTSWHQVEAQFLEMKNKVRVQLQEGLFSFELSKWRCRASQSLWPWKVRAESMSECYWTQLARRGGMWRLRNYVDPSKNCEVRMLESLYAAVEVDGNR